MLVYRLSIHTSGLNFFTELKGVKERDWVRQEQERRDTDSNRTRRHVKQIFGHREICNTGHGIASQSRESSRRGGMRPSEVQHEAWENYKQRGQSAR